MNTASSSQSGSMNTYEHEVILVVQSSTTVYLSYVYTIFSTIYRTCVQVLCTMYVQDLVEV